MRPESVHITLKFLGDVEINKIEEIAQMVQTVSKNHTSFSLTIEGTGVFPNGRNPRVLWVGIQQGAEEITALASQIENGLVELGYPKEKRAYSPHLTIGRIRSSRGIDATLKAMNQMEFQGEPFRVEEILIMQSELQPSGAVYTPLKKIKL